MKRALVTICAAGSLLLCVAAAALWVRSYWGSDYVGRATTDPADPMTTRRMKVQWTRGQVRIGRETHTYYPPPNYVIDHSSRPAGPLWGYGRLGSGHMGWEPIETSGGGSIWNRLGFRSYQTGVGASFFDMTEQGVTIPAALPVILFALLPAACAVAIRRRRGRRQAGHCPVCNYDLRATPGRCPECGTAAA